MDRLELAALFVQSMLRNHRICEGDVRGGHGEVLVDNALTMADDLLNKTGGEPEPGAWLGDKVR